MSKKLVTKSEFARLAGVNPSTTTRLCKTVLAPSLKGKFIDAAHPTAVEYLKSRELAQMPPPATGLDPLHEFAVEFCTARDVYTASALMKKFKIGGDRARAIIKTMRVAGVIPADVNPQTGKAPIVRMTEKEFMQKMEGAAPKEAPKPRGNAAANITKKKEALAAMVAAPTAHEVPEDIQPFAHMTLTELIERYGTDTAFLDWLKSLKAIEDIVEKRLKNAERAGNLISRELVKVGIIDTIDGAFTRMLSDGAKTIAVRAGALIKTGGDPQALEELVSKQLGTFIRPTKSKISRILRNA